MTFNSHDQVSSCGLEWGFELRAVIRASARGSALARAQCKASNLYTYQ